MMHVHTLFYLSVFLPLCPLGPPSEVSNLTLVSVTTSTITLSWDKPFAFESAPVLGYHIQYSSGTCRPNSNSPLVSANELSFTLKGLRDGTIYCIVVSALSTAGQGGTTRIWASTEGEESITADVCFTHRFISLYCIHLMG